MIYNEELIKINIAKYADYLFVDSTLFQFRQFPIVNLRFLIWIKQQLYNAGDLIEKLRNNVAWIKCKSEITVYLFSESFQ